MDIELLDRYGSVVPAVLGYGEDEVEFESGQSVSIGALLLLGYTIRKAAPVSGAVRLQEGSQV